MRALGSVLLATALLAAGPSGTAAEAQPPPRALVFGGGWFDFKRRQNQAALGYVEYRVRNRHAPVRPFACVLFTTDGALYACVGIGYELSLGPRVVVTPSLAPGAYAKGGGKDLGFPIEFRSQIEIAYRFRGGSRLGLAFSHLSNGSTGRRNPGEESLVLSYEVSLQKLFRRRDGKPLSPRVPVDPGGEAEKDREAEPVPPGREPGSDPQ